jgi:hypothetical protein
MSRPDDLGRVQCRLTVISRKCDMMRNKDDKKTNIEKKHRNVSNVMACLVWSVWAHGPRGLGVVGL